MSSSGDYLGPDWNRTGPDADLRDVHTGFPIGELEHDHGWVRLGDGLVASDMDPGYNPQLRAMVEQPRAHQWAPPAPAPRHTIPQPSEAEVMQRCLSWLRGFVSNTVQHASGWIEVPLEAYGRGSVLVIANAIAGSVRVRLSAPLLDDVPLTPDLTRYFAYEAQDYAYGGVRMKVMPGGLGCLTYDFQLIGDTMTRDELVTAVSIIATDSDNELAKSLQQRFGGRIWIPPAKR